jgi:hypothetical protein
MGESLKNTSVLKLLGLPNDLAGEVFADDHPNHNWILRKREVPITISPENRPEFELERALAGSVDRLIRNAKLPGHFPGARRLPSRRTP